MQGSRAIAKIKNQSKPITGSMSKQDKIVRRPKVDTTARVQVPVLELSDRFFWFQCSIES